ncbi:hypothetical protein [Persephonella sp.]
MDKENKISFLRTLSLLDKEKEINIRERLLSELNENLQSKNIDEIEQIIYDLLKGLENNEEFLTEIIKLESIEIDKIIEKINNKITNNPSDLNYINEKHVHLIELLIKHKLLNIIYSKNYITKLINLVVSLIANLNSTRQLTNYWNNPTQQQFKGSLQEIIFTNKDLVNLFYLHFLNVNTNNEEDFRKYVNQIQNNLKITIGFYIGILPKIQQAKESLIPFSIITIFTEIYNQPAQINGIGQIDISDIFQRISQDKTLHSNIRESLKVLKELDLIYDFLKKLKSIQIDNNFTTLILKIILEQNLYTNKILIDFCILFSSKVPNEYKRTLTNKNKENGYWYKDLVLENLSSKKNILYDEALKFLQFIENWHKNKKLKEKVKEFIKNNINQLLEKDNIFNIYKILMENGEKFELNYTTKDIGKRLIDIFWELDNENEKLIYIFESINKLFKEQDLNILKSKLFEEVIDNLEILSDYQYKILERSKALLKIDSNQIEELFKKLIDIRHNKNSFLLFKIVIENNRQKLNDNLKTDFKEKLEDIKENVENEDIVETIDEILGIL